jgi:hypothetical protein
LNGECQKLGVLADLLRKRIALDDQISKSYINVEQKIRAIDEVSVEAKTENTSFESLSESKSSDGITSTPQTTPTSQMVMYLS